LFGRLEDIAISILKSVGIVGESSRQPVPSRRAWRDRLSSRKAARVIFEPLNTE
jgi:hypothetical protein